MSKGVGFPRSSRWTAAGGVKRADTSPRMSVWGSTRARRPRDGARRGSRGRRMARRRGFDPARPGFVELFDRQRRGQRGSSSQPAWGACGPIPIVETLPGRRRPHYRLRTGRPPRKASMQQWPCEKGDVRRNRSSSFIAALHVEPVEDAMCDRRENDASGEDHSQAAVKRIHACKELAVKGDRCIHRAHAAEEH